MPELKRISDRQIEALNAIAEAGQAIAAALRETHDTAALAKEGRITFSDAYRIAERRVGRRAAEIDAPVPAVEPQGGSGDSRTLGRVWTLYNDTCARTKDGCSDDLENFLADLRSALDGPTT